MNTLHIDRQETKDSLLLKLAGQIDEEADYSTAAATGFPRVTIDFEGIKLINSTGLQRWIRFLSGVDAQARFVFARCSVRVVTQINMFPGFTAGRDVEVASFFAPYFCEACDQSRELLIEVAQHREALSAGKAPRMQCPSCKSDAEFDGLEKKYLMFLKA